MRAIGLSVLTPERRAEREAVREAMRILRGPRPRRRDPRSVLLTLAVMLAAALAWRAVRGW